MSARQQSKRARFYALARAIRECLKQGKPMVLFVPKRYWHKLGLIAANLITTHQEGFRLVSSTPYSESYTNERGDYLAFMHSEP